MQPPQQLTRRSRVAPHIVGAMVTAGGEEPRFQPSSTRGQTLPRLRPTDAIPLLQAITGRLKAFSRHFESPRARRTTAGGEEICLELMGMHDRGRNLIGRKEARGRTMNEAYVEPRGEGS